MSEPPSEPSAPESPRGRWWKQPLVWSVVLSAGFLVYELTANPILGVVLVCTRFGWPDFVVAYRLWCVDPNRARMRTMSSMYLAYGLTKIGFVAGVLFYGAFCLCGVGVILWGPAPGQGPLQAAQFGQGLLGRIASSLVTCVVVFLLAAVATGGGFWYANRFSIKVWLGPYFVYRAHAGPAKGQLQTSTNCARMLLRLGLVPTWLGAYGWFIAVLAIVDRGMPLTTVVGLMLVPVPIALAVCAICYRAEQRKLTATKPVECWGTDLVGAIMCMEVRTAEKSRWLAAIPRDYWRTEELATRNLRPTDGSAPSASPTLVP